MIRTNVKNKNRFSNFQKHKIASAALVKSTAPKPDVTIIQAIQYPTYVYVYFLRGMKQESGKIRLELLEGFIRTAYNRLLKTDSIDMNISIYLEENLNLVCAAYLTAGKELMS